MKNRRRERSRRPRVRSVRRLGELLPWVCAQAHSTGRPEGSSSCVHG